MSDSEISNDEQERSDCRKLVAQNNRKKRKPGGFQSMGFSQNVFKGLTRKGYKVPTPIQRKAIPVILDGKDVVAMARTGSGKTATFLLPMFEKLVTHSAKSGARALIMSPTRELALQTLKFAKELGKYTGLKAAVVLGGDRMEDQFEALHSNPDIIIATPGRFMHVAVEMNLKLKSVQYVVFDEADRLFEMGFQEQLNEILNRLPESRQTLLFSATLPKLLVDFAKAGLHDPTLIRLDLDSKLSDQLKTSFLLCRAEDKLALLLHILTHSIHDGEQTVVFAATKHHVEYINMVLQRAQIPCTYIYSSLDATARKINLAKFQHAKVMVMIVTDIAARGIDIPLLDNVINFHFPAKPKLFVHRVGRVARAGRSGVAYSMVAPDEVPYMLDLHLFLGRPLKFMTLGKTLKDEDGLCGRVPQTVIDEQDESLKIWREELTDIKAQIKVCSNAYGHYLRSRPTPAPESMKRVKEMEKQMQQISIHPLFGIEENSQEAERTKLLNALKSYKSNTTIFEINSTTKASGLSVMKKKRMFHDKVVKRKQNTVQELSRNTSAEDDIVKADNADEMDVQDAFGVVIGGKSSRSNHLENGIQNVGKGKQNVRDNDNYISYRPADDKSEQGLRLGSSFDKEVCGFVMDVNGDDEDVAKMKTNSLKWDRKRKRFVRENNEDPKKKKIRTESGAWISASYKSNAYKDWVKKARVDTTVDNTDQSEERSNPNNRRRKNKLTVMGLADFRRGHFKGSERDGYNNRNRFKKNKSELKRPEQIIKARKAKFKKQSKQQGRKKKHTKK